MIKLLFKFVLVYFISTVTVFSQIISSIDVSGNKRISKESVIVFSELKIGMNYSQELINQSLKKLYKTNFFENVEISYENSDLKINLVEYPIIANLEITGIKKSSFLDFIKENMILKERTSFSNFQLQNDLKMIDNILKTNGYYFSNLQSSFNTDLDLNTINLKIEIDLGEKAKIKKISFLGNKIFKDKKLTEVIASEENKFWKFISKNVYLNKQLINLDKRLLNNFYKNRGYYNVKILDNHVEFNKKNSSFNLIYNIDAGEKFTINDLLIELPDDYSKNDFSGIFKTFEKNKNKIYSLEFIEEILVELENIASNRSYEFIDVSVEENIVENNKINFKFLVSDSSKFYIERINIFGNYTTRRSFEKQTYY